MTHITDRSSFQPQGWHTVTPRIIVPEAKRLVDFLKNVFGASGDYSSDAPTELRIGDSVVMISDSGIRLPALAYLYVYVEDADETWRRAVAAGARSIEEPMDTPYGDRRGMITDQWGNTWQIATRRVHKGLG